MSLCFNINFTSKYEREKSSQLEIPLRNRRHHLIVPGVGVDVRKGVLDVKIHVPRNAEIHVGATALEDVLVDAPVVLAVVLASALMVALAVREGALEAVRAVALGVALADVLDVGLLVAHHVQADVVESAAVLAVLHVKNNVAMIVPLGAGMIALVIAIIVAEISAIIVVINNVITAVITIVTVNALIPVGQVVIQVATMDARIIVQPAALTPA